VTLRAWHGCSLQFAQLLQLLTQMGDAACRRSL